VAAPVLALLKEREPRFQAIKTRAAVRTARPGLRAVAASRATEEPVEDEELEAASAVAASPATRPAPGGAARPRPSTSRNRKKGRPQGKAKRRRR
jgi:hypothetical protein